MELFTLAILVGGMGICGLVGRALAEGKGRGTAGFWLGFCFGPIGIVIAVLLGPPIEARSNNLHAETADLAALIAEKGKVGISVNPSDGRTIASVATGSSAAEAGVQRNDRLIAIDGGLVEGDYRNVVLRLVGEPGSTVRVTVRRGERALDFTLERRSNVEPNLAALVWGKGKVGLRIDPSDGRTISSVAAGGPGARAGVQQNDRLIAIDGSLVDGDHKAVFLRLIGEPGSMVKITVQRGDRVFVFELVRQVTDPGA